MQSMGAQLTMLLDLEGVRLASTSEPAELIGAVATRFRSNWPHL